MTKLGSYNMEDFAVNPNNNDHIFVAGQSSGLGMALHKSLNAGSTWTTYQTASSGIAHSVAIDPNNDQVIYLGGNNGSSGAVFKSVNGGGNWSQITGTITGTVETLAVDPGWANRVYAGSYAGIYKSEDGGASWSKKSTFYDITCIKINPNNRNEVYAGSGSGVYRSLDSGESWTQYSTGMSTTDVLCLEMDPVSMILYAGTSSGGVFKNALSSKYSLLIQATTGGTTNPAAGTYQYSPGATVSVTATAAAHYLFTGWTGDASGTSNPASVVMDSNKSITANFQEKIDAPVNFTGVKIEDRSLLRARYFNRLTWQANPNNINIAKYRIYRVNGSAKTLLDEVGAGIFEYRHLNVGKNEAVTYACAAVSNGGREGDAAVIIIQ